jgi:hypothetical protein
MADDNLYDSEEDEDYKPDLEKPVKQSRKNGQKEHQLEFGRTGSAVTVDNSEKLSITDPLAQLKTDAKKAKINAIWEQLNAKDTALSSRAVRGVPAPSKVAVSTPDC